MLVLFWWLKQKFALFSKRCHQLTFVINEISFCLNRVHQTFQIKIRLFVIAEFLCWRASHSFTKFRRLLLWWVFLFTFLIQIWCGFFWLFWVIVINHYSSQWNRTIYFIIHFHDWRWTEVENSWWVTRVWNNIWLI